MESFGFNKLWLKVKEHIEHNEEYLSKLCVFSKDIMKFKGGSEQGNLIENFYKELLSSFIYKDYSFDDDFAKKKADFVFKNDNNFFIINSKSTIRKGNVPLSFNIKLIDNSRTTYGDIDVMFEKLYNMNLYILGTVWGTKENKGFIYIASIKEVVDRFYNCDVNQSFVNYSSHYLMRCKDFIKISKEKKRTIFFNMDKDFYNKYYDRKMNEKKSVTKLIK